MIHFHRIRESNAESAYEWYCNFTKANDLLLPRGELDYGQLVLNGSVWCARSGNDYCGMAYYADDNGAWEIGGLMVAASQQGSGIGSVLIRLVLGTVLTDMDPLASGERVITHVHSENESPRGIITTILRFAHSKSVKIPGSQLPGLRTDEKGNINGDEFELSMPDSLTALAEWCDDWSGQLKNGMPAEIIMPNGRSLNGWASDFREMISEYNLNR